MTRRAVRRVVSVRLVGLLALSSCACAPSHPAAARETTAVVLVLQRNNRLSVFDAADLSLRGYFVTEGLGDGMAARADGRAVFINQPTLRDRHACCSVHVLDFGTGRMCHVSDDGTLPTIAGDRLFVGSRVLDVHTLAPVGRRRALSPRGLRASPDGRWWVSSSAATSIDLLDAEWNHVRTYAVPDGLTSRLGAWSDGVYYLYAHDDAEQFLVRLTPSSELLGAPVPVQWPVPSPHAPTFLAAGRNLVSFQRYGSGLVGTPNQATFPLVGGAFVIDPSDGTIVRRIEPQMFFRDLVVTPDGHDLYGVQDWPQPDSVRFVRVDLGSGAVRADVALYPNTAAPDALSEQWTLAFVRMPTSLVPRGEVRPRPCQ